MKLANIAESSLSRIHSKMQKHASGAITAYRGEYTHRENQQRNKSLLAKLRAGERSVTAIKGTYIEGVGTDNEADPAYEHSYFVSSKVVGDDGHELQNLLMALGEEFDQDSILSIPFGETAMLIGTSDREDAYPPNREHVPQGNFKGGKAGMFMSQIHNRGFVFEDIDDRLSNVTRYGIALCAREKWQDLTFNGTEEGNRKLYG